MTRQLSIILITIALVTTTGHSQTAVNFQCFDCNGIHHDLFDELDAGKVIVICWVMPCGACVGPSLTTFNVVSSFDETHPDQVKMYLVDDFANTNCTSLGSWASSYGLTKATLFSDASISMLDYGTIGMPKVVVVGDVNHAVFYNANNSVNATQLQSAILEALNAITTRIAEAATQSNISVYPSPASTYVNLVVNETLLPRCYYEIYNHTGKKVTEAIQVTGNGHVVIDLNREGLTDGIYLMKVTGENHQEIIKFAVAR